MDAIVKHLLSITDFGLKMRLFSGVALSVFDIVSDVYMIVVFLGSEETRGVAHVNIACVALSLLLQLFMAWFVNKRRSWRRITREALYVVAFIKPGIDAARVAAGNENDDGLATIDPLLELVSGKVIEIVVEAIPAGAFAIRACILSRTDPSPPLTRAAIIQTRAFIISENRSRAALVSIIISCCTTGFAGATMWFDYDTSPAKRKLSPRLAGATPDTSRGLFFFLLVMSGALQVVAKSFSSALLIIASPNLFLAYTVGDHLLFQIYLVVRGDHCIIAPGASVATSVTSNLIYKVIADFTSSWIMRSPIFMHNAYVRTSERSCYYPSCSPDRVRRYFLFNQLTTHTSVFVSVRVYVGAGFTHLPVEMLWNSAGSLFAAWALTYVAQAHDTW
jgi:hypothetical protein